MSRKSGYYWCHNKEVWIIMYWDSSYKRWYMSGSEYSFKDSDFSEIDPNPIVREEAPQVEYDQKYLDWVKYNQKKS